jgi:ATP-dependent DNA helicase PIF1
MVDGDLFDKLERVARILKKNERPFGGIQLVVTGDFFQLPPVSKGETRFAFEAECWSDVIPRTFNLTKVFRQADQSEYSVKWTGDWKLIFHSIRRHAERDEIWPFDCRVDKEIQKPYPSDQTSWRDRPHRTVSYPEYWPYTPLTPCRFPRRENVETSNGAKNRTLDGETHIYKAYDSGKMDPDQREKLLQNCMWPSVLELKVGSQVMLVKNKDDTLVNGSMGIVRHFKDNSVKPGDDPEAAKKKPKADARLWPVVEFTNGRMEVIEQEQWKAELPNGEVQAARNQVCMLIVHRRSRHSMASQLPLILSWAMSIHKSQGQTLDYVKVDLGRVFEKGVSSKELTRWCGVLTCPLGQAYVALSRATSLEGLQVLGFDEKKVLHRPNVPHSTLISCCSIAGHGTS